MMSFDDLPVKAQAFLIQQRLERASIEPISGSGSNRQYFRLADNGQTWVLCYHDFVAENQSFLYFQDLFTAHGASVPNVLAKSACGYVYLLNDLGAQDLLQWISSHPHKKMDILAHCIGQLVDLQYHTQSSIDYTQCYDHQSFNHRVALQDLNYFKHYFLDMLVPNYSKAQLSQEFEHLAFQIAHLPFQHFMYRDFQSRNVMMHHDAPYFIDFQGGMKGCVVYDLISLIWQAKLGLSASEKDQLISHHQDRLIQYWPEDYTPTQYQQSYDYCLIVRLLQVLGAYGFRGLIEKKAHFIDSIVPALDNIRYLTEHSLILPQYPLLKSLLIELGSPEILTAITQKIHD